MGLSNDRHICNLKEKDGLLQVEVVQYIHRHCSEGHGPRRWRVVGMDVLKFER